jgi:hypothetical protein
MSSPCPRQAVEFLYRDSAFAVRSLRVDERVERHHRHGHIRRVGGDAVL